MARGKPKADVGILLVHGIGKQAPGETLHSFVTPLTEILRGNGIDVRVPTDCERGHVKSSHLHCTVSNSSNESAPEWLIAECYWDDLVEEMDPKALNDWVVSASVEAPVWQITSSAIGGFNRRLRSPSGRNPFSWYSWACNLLWSTLLRPLCAYVLLALTRLDIVSVLSESRGRIGRAAWKATLFTLGDAYAFVQDDSLSRSLRRRFWERFLEVRRASKKVLVVAHSQGAALAHASLREKQTSPDCFIGVGSGLAILAATKTPERWLAPSIRPLLSLLLAIGAWLFASVAIFQSLVTITIALLLLALLAMLSLIEIGLIIVALLGSQPLDFSNVLTDGAGLWQAAQTGAPGWRLFLLTSAFSSLVFIGVFLFLGWLGRRLCGWPKMLNPGDLTLKGLTPSNWLEVFSPLDPVSVGIAGNPLATLVRVQNPTGWRLWLEHVRYFDRNAKGMHAICQKVLLMSGMSAYIQPPAASMLLRLRWILIECVAVAAWLVYFFLNVYGK